ncbi:MAG: hypothetical protein NC347_15550 [Clostridium sp.]|nr:hypothetical protein [Clostridium sp.]
MKLIGYVPMKKRTGKVLFVTEKGASPVVGQSCDKVFVYDELSNRITENSIGHDIVINYSRGYNGNAYVADVVIK